MVNAVTDQTFPTEVLQSELPVLVDFWAPWCGPCKAMSPALEEFANRHQGQVKVVKVNVDEETAHAAKYAIRAVPTLILFKDGAPHKTAVGAQTLAKLEQLLT